MMTDINITSQWILMPKRSCQMSTDSPKDAAIELPAVPTITSAATRERVRISMIRKIRVSADTTAIMRSYFVPLAMSLKVAGRTAKIDFGVRQGGHLQARLRGRAPRTDSRDPSRSHGILLVGDEIASGFALG